VNVRVSCKTHEFYKRLIRLLCLGLLLAVYPWSAHARTWHVRQGDVLSADIAIPSTLCHVSASAFHKMWPFHKTENGTIRIWIGVDMETRPKAYRMIIQGKTPAGKTWKRRYEIVVQKASFRISRIQVKKRMAEFDAKSLARLRADQAALKRTYGVRVDADPEIRFDQMPIQGIISTPFGARRIVNGEPRSPHSGVDIAAPKGTPIRLPLAGRVLLAESMFLNGNAVAIGHGNGLVSVYTHMQRLEVHQGQWLKTGDRIGAVGQTGRATGPHLHWGVRYLNARVNPLSIIR